MILSALYWSRALAILFNVQEFSLWYIVWIQEYVSHEKHLLVLLLLQYPLSLSLLSFQPHSCHLETRMGLCFFGQKKNEFKKNQKSAVKPRKNCHHILDLCWPQWLFLRRRFRPALLKANNLSCSDSYPALINTLHRSLPQILNEP